MIRATCQQWRACNNIFAEHPAFILGNGPTLPSDLSCLRDFFTVGVNRILRVFDPTVIMWFERSTSVAISSYLQNAKAVPFTTRQVNNGAWNVLGPHGTAGECINAPLVWPDYVVNTGSSGASAAYWAMSLGCRPIYLLGMSAKYQQGRTNFYGDNPYHKTATLGQLGRARKQLLRYASIYPILDQGQLDEIADLLKDFAMGRAWYVEQFRQRQVQVEDAPPIPSNTEDPLTIAQEILIDRPRLSKTQA